jgi:hypothetical protein
VAGSRGELCQLRPCRLAAYLPQNEYELAKVNPAMVV